MKTKISNIFILMLLVTIIACKGDKKKAEDKETNKTEKPKEIQNVTMEDKKANSARAAFETFEGSYKEDGKYTKKIAIPYKTERIGGSDVLLKPTRQDVQGIENDSVFIIFELYQHRKNNTDDLYRETTEVTIYGGNLNDEFNNFDPSEEKTVFVVSLHDEDFLDYEASDLEDFYEYLLERASDCLEKPEDCIFSQDAVDDILGDDDINIKMPRRIGNGVLVPKFK